MFGASGKQDISLPLKTYRSGEKDKQGISVQSWGAKRRAI